jgi:hypothetical protein
MHQHQILLPRVRDAEDTVTKWASYVLKTHSSLGQNESLINLGPVMFAVIDGVMFTQRKYQLGRVLSQQ